MKDDNNLCYFLRAHKICGALSGTTCDGVNLNCKFYKTEKMFSDARDSAIQRCREHGNCKDCKYRPVPCKLSSETQKEEFVTI